MVDSPWLCCPAFGDFLANCEKPARGELTVPINPSVHGHEGRRLVMHRIAYHFSRTGWEHGFRMVTRVLSPVLPLPSSVTLSR